MAGYLDCVDLRAGTQRLPKFDFKWWKGTESNSRFRDPRTAWEVLPNMKSLPCLGDSGKLNTHDNKVRGKSKHFKVTTTTKSPTTAYVTLGTAKTKT